MGSQLERGRLLGLIILLLSVILSIAYLWAMFSGRGDIAIKVVVSIGFLVAMGILAWLGWIMFSIKPIEEIPELKEETKGD